MKYATFIEYGTRPMTGRIRPSIKHAAERLEPILLNPKIRYIDCKGCAASVRLRDGSGQCEWCGRGYSEEEKQ